MSGKGKGGRGKGKAKSSGSSSSASKAGLQFPVARLNRYLRIPPGATFDDDPLLKRARALRDTAAQITADLGGAPAAPVVVAAPPPSYEVPTEEAELVARAKALLADYDPQPSKARPSNFEYGQLVNARRRRADAMRGARAIGR